MRVRKGYKDTQVNIYEYSAFGFQNVQLNDEQVTGRQMRAYQ
jgi:hypothetical protein